MGFELRAALDGNGQVVTAHLRAELLQGDLRMVARGERLDDLRHPLGKESRQQNGRLYLRAGHRKLVTERGERTAPNGKRRPAVLGRLDFSAHLFERRDDARHRTTGERLVPLDH